MVQKIQIRRTEVANLPPTDGSLQPGELVVEMNTPTRLWTGVPTTIDPSGKKLLIDTSISGGGGLDQVTADGLYVNVAGDTMSGALNVIPTAATDGLTIGGAATQGQVVATGASADVGIHYAAKGAAGHFFYTGSFANLQAAFGHNTVAGYVSINGGDGAINFSMQGGAGNGEITIFNPTLTGEITATIDCGEWL